MQTPTVTGAEARPTPEVVDRDATGFNSLDSKGFMKLLITQLQNQDPSKPITNDELLSQISSMRNLQADIELSEALESLTKNQQLSSATSFVGKEVTGTSGDDKEVTGIVDRALLRDGKAFVGIGKSEISLQDILSVGLPRASSGASDEQ